MPCSRPPLDRIERAERDERVAAREVARARAGATRANRTADHARAAEHDDRADAAADAGERAWQHTEVVLADGDPGDRDRAVHRRREHHADRRCR